VIRYEAFIEKSWRESGLTPLIVARLRDDGRADIGFFLVDFWCLGVKDAFLHADDSEAGLRDLLDTELPADFRERIHPACAKKIIDGALAYAEQLGFAPPRDFRKARRALAGLDAAACPETFTFGRDGRPCYVEGPNDTPERTERVLAMLESRFGPEGFDCELLDDEEDHDALDAREALRMFFEDLPSGPDFYEFAGLTAGLHFAPVPSTPLRLLECLRDRFAITWRDDAAARDFADDLRVYWNHIADLTSACAGAPPEDPEADPLDIYSDDFESEPDPRLREDHLTISTVLWCRGLVRSTEFWPELWGDTLARPDLLPHWTLLRAYSEPEKPESRSILRQAAENADPATRSRLVPRAVLHLVHALHRPSAP
jgi:hypothetical protein